jgi:hypothetical protein
MAGFFIAIFCQRNGNVKAVSCISKIFFITL